MVRLDQNISELLFQYDCVIVPELGGFVTNYSPAKLDENSSIFSPPSKALSFNRYLKKNDGLLAKYIADKESLSFKEVNDQIRSQVEEYFTLLNKGEKVVFEKVGILYMDNTKKIQFSPDLSTNYLLESFGLRRVFAHAEEIVETKTVKFIPKKEISKEKTIPVVVSKKEKVSIEPVLEELDEGLKKRIWRSAAVIIPLAFLSYFMSEPIEMSKNNLSNLNPFKDSIPQLYMERISDVAVPEINLKTDFPDLFDLPESEKTILFSLTDNPGDAIHVNVGEKKKLSVKKAIIKKSDAVIDGYMAPNRIGSLRYHIIAGCFGELKNAEKKTKRLRKKGFDAFIIDKRNGLYRVVYGSSSVKNEAMILLQAVKQNEDRGAWLLKK